jgi:hypothetical protein
MRRTGTPLGERLGEERHLFLIWQAADAVFRRTRICLIMRRRQGNLARRSTVCWMSPASSKDDTGKVRDEAFSFSERSRVIGNESGK